MINHVPSPKPLRHCWDAWEVTATCCSTWDPTVWDRYLPNLRKSLRDLEMDQTYRQVDLWNEGRSHSPTQNMTCTYNGKSVYIHILKADRDTITSHTATDADQNIECKSHQQQSCQIISDKKGLEIGVLPAAQRTEIATTIELTLSKSAEAAVSSVRSRPLAPLAYNKKSDSLQFCRSVSCTDAAAAVDDNPNTFWTLGRKSYINCDKYFGSKLHYVRSRQELCNIFANQWLAWGRLRQGTDGRACRKW